MGQPTKLETALMLVPFDLMGILIAYGADRAFTWMGERPKDEKEFFFDLGKLIFQQTADAWEKELGYREEKF